MPIDKHCFPSAILECECSLARRDLLGRAATGFMVMLLSLLAAV